MAFVDHAAAQWYAPRGYEVTSRKMTMMQKIQWTFAQNNPVVRPGQLHRQWDAGSAGAGHVLDLGDRYRMYYWGSVQGANSILMAESPKARPNDWQPVGGQLLGPQPETDHNFAGPCFPFVYPVDGDRWHMIFCGWGKPRPDGVISNTTDLAVSDDAGLTWRYHPPIPLIPLDQPFDRLATGSAWVVRAGDEFRMYYTAIGEYFARPAGVQTGHGDWLPRIGIGYAVSRDGLHWQKPFHHLLIAPRGFDAEPYEYINSKPCVIRDGTGWRMFISTFGPAYRVRSLVSADGVTWQRVPSGPEGDLGVGGPGSFDDQQRSYASVIQDGDQYHLWYTGNRFGATGMGYCRGQLG